MTQYEPLYLAGIECFNQQAYFESHEIWEDLWNETQDEAKQFYKGLIQASVALYHLSRNNISGAQKLLARSRNHLAPYRPRYLGLDIDRFLGEVSHRVEQVAAQRGYTVPPRFPPAPSPTIRLQPSPRS